MKLVVQRGLREGSGRFSWEQRLERSSVKQRGLLEGLRVGEIVGVSVGLVRLGEC